jgi:pimeloyl-ACP methyl ester carboxylesterase
MPDGAVAWHDAGASGPVERTLKTADGVRLLVREWRPSPASAAHARAPLVLCDGLGCDGYIWRYVVQQFAGERRIVHLTNRGHGASDTPRDLAAVSLERIVADLALTLDDANVHGAVLIGHSMGVQVALEAFRALRAPQVRGLALLCGSYQRPIETFRAPPLAKDETSWRSTIGNGAIRRFFDPVTSFAADEWDRIRPVWSRILRSRFALDAALQELTADLIHEDDFRPCLTHLAQMDMRVFVTLARDMAQHSAADLLPTIDVPTLVVGGARDRFCPLWISEQLFALLGPCAGHKDLVRLVRGSHAAPIEEPRIIGAAITRLLAHVDRADRQ